MELEITSTFGRQGSRETEVLSVPFLPDGGKEKNLINLYPRHRYQTFDGFGGAITESAAYVYSLMDDGDKKRLIDEYFRPGGMDYRFVRLSLDSCDFSLGHYEADGDEEDAALERFSLERVEKTVLPMLRDAEAAHGDKLRVMLSPWSPPAYMKTNGERNRGGKLRPEYRKRWAEYICRYILELRARGFRAELLTLQNEPKAAQRWDSCIYTAREEKEFLRDFMWPALCRHGLEDVEIYLWDHNKERALEWAETIIDDSTAHMVAGIAFHWYSGDHFEALRMIRERFPDKKLLLSEACIEFSKFGAHSGLYGGEKYAHELIGNLNEGMSVFLDWNLLLDETGGPNHVSNFCDAPFLYDRDEKRLEPREIYHYLSHFTHFIKPDSVRIGLSRYTDKLEATAFENGGEICVILLNRTDEELPARIRLGNETAEVAVMPHAICTGVIKTA